MKLNNEILRLGITLMLIGLVASLALALTNQFTLPKIQQQIELQLQNSLRKVVPDADKFEEQETYYEALKQDKLIGRVLKIDAPGYSSIMQLLVGIDLDNIIQGIAVLSQVETPGLGANVEKDPFLSQFKGKDISAVKLIKDGGNIDAITGATITSRAVADNIRESIKNYDFKETYDSPIGNETEND